MISFSWLILIMSPLLIFMNFNWFLMWVMIELSTFSFLSIMWNKWFIMVHENRMKYFCVQTISSIFLIFLFCVIYLTKYQWINSTSNFLFFILLFKLGSVPFHSWFVNLSKNLNYKNMFILNTWQKIIPIFMMLIFISITLSIIILLINMLISVFSQLFSFDIKILLSFSSVSNLSWMLISILISLKVILVFCLFYFIVMGELMKKLKMLNMKIMNFNLNSIQIKWLFLSLLSISGIPPFLGFIPKWMVLKNTLSFKWFNILLILLILTVLNSMIYLRICWNNLFLNFNLVNLKMNYNDNNISFMINLSFTLL
uniref:NADH-ubiquinone oxidoreductase chain 2 n=1 Tax=Spinibdella lignicola TaxID=2872682 RepID=A0A977S6B6_9ACAR|nr:NADH dehydrogenase subunit 2 [Spinibdella lignicola]UXN44126.1 NADH dehydrogenase subunit 2 [Spinibdella lignicola]